MQVRPQKYSETTFFDNVFLNLYDFWNIAVSQRNASTSVRYGGLCSIYLVENVFMSLSVKESWKSINFSRSYRH